MSIILGAGSDAWGIWHASHPSQIPWERYLDEVSEAGYNFVEPGLYGYLPLRSSAALKALSSHSLSVPGGTFFIDVLDYKNINKTIDQLDRTANWLASVGAKYLVLLDVFYRDPATGVRNRPSRLTDSEWDIFIDSIHQLGARCKTEHGLELVFHPHCDATIELEEDITRLLDSTDKELVNLCLDTGHHLYSGGDPTTFWLKHYERIPYLHLKSMNAQMLKTVQREDLPWEVAVARGVTDEPSRGAVDFHAFSQALKETNFNGYAIVEQDMFPCDPNVPLPLAKRTITYLKSLGFVT